MSRDDPEARSVSSPPTVKGRDSTGLSSGSQRDGVAEDSRPVADLVERAADLVDPIKPRLRGWLHAGLVPASLAAGIVLICQAGTPQAVLACTVYSVTAWLLFGTSAVYHLGTWGPLGEAVLRRLDHANIFLIIAGTCTPLAVLLLPRDQWSVLLWIVWTGALVGFAFRVLWVGAPRWLYTPCYLALGWAPVRYLANQPCALSPVPPVPPAGCGAGQARLMFSAWGPFWPWVTSNVTVWPSWSSRKPVELIAE